MLRPKSIWLITRRWITANMWHFKSDFFGVERGEDIVDRVSVWITTVVPYRIGALKQSWKVGITLGRLMSYILVHDWTNIVSSVTFESLIVSVATPHALLSIVSVNYLSLILVFDAVLGDQSVERSAGSSFSTLDQRRFHDPLGSTLSLFGEILSPLLLGIDILLIREATTGLIWYDNLRELSLQNG